MHITTLATSFTEDDLFRNSPFVAGLHKLRYEKGNFHEVMLGYHESTEQVPFYTFSDEEICRLANACESVYDMLYDAVGLVLNNIPRDTIHHFFGEEFLSCYPDFIDYARYTYNAKQPAIYGRYDLTFSPNGDIKFYEFNGDTPTMLFESSCINHIMLEKVGLENKQFNDWQEHFIANVNHIVKPGGRLAVIAKMDITTDAMTAEYIYNTAITAGVDAVLMDFTDLEYDMLDKRFHYKGDIFDAVYILQPWEEMVESSPDIIGEWRHWADQCVFFEPAWRWFTSNKGIWAVVYSALIRGDTIPHPGFKEFQTKHAHNLQYLIPTYLPGTQPDELKDYVTKPKIGRCSQSIRVYKDGQQTLDTGGWYHDHENIIQQWHPAPRLPDRNQFVTCMWMAPYGYEYDKMTMAASVVTVRECVGDITNISQESIYPCMIE